MNLGNRTAIVTGAAQGIGEAIARALHQKGAAVVLADIDAAGAAEKAASIDPKLRRTASAEVDVRDLASFQRLLDTAVNEWGGVDILVNNAARTVSGSFWEIEAAEWDEILAVNLRSVFFGCQIVGAHMRERGWGRIINLTSLAGQQGGLTTGAHYAASKAGIIVLTKIVARELAPNGVTVNAIAPAAIRTPAMGSMLSEEIEDFGRRVIPVGRVGEPEEVAALAAFVASDEAGYITGATLDINGGILMR